MGEGGGADAALGPDEGHLASDKGRGGIAVEGADGADQLQRVQRRRQVLAHAAAHQLAIEGDVVGGADDDHLGAGVADLGELVQQAEHDLLGIGALDHHQGGGRLVLVVLYCGGQAARPHGGGGARQPAVADGLVGERGGGGFLAEEMDGDARDRRLRRPGSRPGLRLAGRMHGRPGLGLPLRGRLGHGEAAELFRHVRRTGRRHVGGGIGELVRGVEAGVEIVVEIGTGRHDQLDPPDPLDPLVEPLAWLSWTVDVALPWRYWSKT